MHEPISLAPRPLAGLGTALLVLVCATLGRTAHAHGAVADRTAEPPSPAAVQSAFLEHSYRVFSDLALRCPTSRQDAVMAAAEAIYRVVWDWRPSPAAAEEVQRVEAETRDCWRLVEGEYPTLRVSVTRSSVSVQPCKPIPVARGLERCVLLRLANAGAEKLALTAEVGGAPVGAISLPNLRRDPDDARWLLVPIVAPGLDTRAIDVQFPGIGAIQVSVTVSEPAVLRGRILDHKTGKPWPGRVRVCGSDGGLRHGEAFKGNSTLSEKPVVFRPASYRLPFFYSDGAFEVIVPPGRTHFTLERGFEFEPVSRSLRLKPGETREVSLSSGRFIDLWNAGWVSGDTHVHWVRNSWDVNEELGLLAMVQRAEDLRVVNNLTLYQYRPAEQGGVFIKPDQYPMGPVPGMCDTAWHVQMAEEYRNDNHYGHINLLGLRTLIRPSATGAGRGGPPGSADYPTNRGAVLEARRQGGISVEAHNLGPCNASAVPVNVILGLADSLDQLDAEHYYRFLNCGVHIGLSNGSDHPARVVGCARVYTRIEGPGGESLPFTYERWLEAVRLGRTFTTSGPLLLLRVNGAQPGDTLDLQRDARLDVEVRAWSRYPLGTLEIVANGEVVKSVDTSATSRRLRVRLPADQSRWFCARVSRTGVWNAILAPDVAHTSAVYTRVDGREVLKAEAAQAWTANVTEHLRRLEATGVFASEDQRRQALDEAREGLRRYEEIFRQARQPTSTPTARPGAP
jgi:hypothetical protein